MPIVGEKMPRLLLLCCSDFDDIPRPYHDLTMATRLKAGILIVSDTAAKDPTTDATGNVLRSTFDQDGGESWEVTEVKIVPDSISEIQRSVLQWSDGANAVNLVITSGGTGFAIKDNTPEVGLILQLIAGPDDPSRQYLR
jgi:molybdopterin biosynthesis enzyme MoaB